MSSRLLTTMAVVRANADQGRDYIALFEPMAADRLKSWSESNPVEPEALARAICDEWGVPSFPANVAKVLLGRAEKKGEVVRVASDRKLYPCPEVLGTSRDVSERKQEMLARMNALSSAVVRYARDVHAFEWTNDEASDALERLAEEFGAELAVARRRGTLHEPGGLDSQPLAVAHGFARWALDEQPANFDHLVAMVQGTMLLNTIYFQDVGHISNRLKVLRVYLDTPVILRALGLGPEPVCDATRELLQLLREFRVSMFVFPHTLDEIGGVLDGVAGSLRRGRRGALAQAGIGGRNREAIDALVKKGVSAGEVDNMNAELEARLNALRIGREETPPHPERGQVDESRFDEVLTEVVGYKSRGPLEKDLRSLAAVDRLRRNERPRDLANTSALFVTSNTALVRAAKQFFEEADRGAPVPHAMHEIGLTAQLWVRAPHPPPDLPRKLLIADCFAALNPGPELWERWVGHIVRLEDRGDISEEQVQNLIYHSQAKSALFEITHGDPDAISEATVAEVLERFESEVRRPAERAAIDEKSRADEAEGEIAELRGEVAALQTKVDAREEATKKRRRVGRTTVGYAGGLLAAAVFAVLALTGLIEGKLWWATSITLLVFLASSSWAWAARRGWKFPFVALVSAGAVSALFVNVFSIAPEPKPEPDAKPVRPLP